MGIAFAIGYIPSFLIAAFIALFLCKQFAIKREKHSTIKIAGIIAGIIICAATTWWAIQLFPFRNSTDFSALIKRLATTLILPLCAGGTFVIFSFFVNKRKKNAGSFLLFLNQIGIGALHAVWVIPLSFLLYMESDSLRYRFTDKHKESVARFEELCSETELNIIKHNTNAKSLYTFINIRGHNTDFKRKLRIGIMSPEISPQRYRQRLSLVLGNI
nr:hypothetical protein [uncultured Desulfobulbus sp.]